MRELISTLETVETKVLRYRAKKINEQDTKASLIDPVLRALGWDVEDLDEVQREYKRKKQDKPVDYALLLLRDPRLFVEAKALGQNLDDRKWANQIMGYASVSGIEWVVLTDGDEYRIYNSHATVPIEDKLFRTVRVSEDLTTACDTLSLLSKDKIREKEIDVLWNAHFVDRQVRSVVEQLFCTDPEPDASIVRLITRRIGNLSAKDVKASLRRAHIRFDFPVDPGAESGRTIRRNDRPQVTSTKTRRKARPTQTSKTKAYIGVSLLDVLQAGMLEPPLRLFKKYKGHELEAELLADGTVTFGGTRYKSCSSAAEHARGSITGRRMNTNGWTFWQFHSPEGKAIQLNDVRQAFRQKHLK